MDPRQRGFSLGESLVTLAVAGTLVTVGVSTVGDLVEGLRLQAVAGDVQYQLMLARSEAIKRNARVVLCKSADGQSCTAAGRWEQGWILFQDRDNSGTREPQEPLLQQPPLVPGGWRIVGNGPVARYVSYGPLGTTELTSGAFQAGTFTVCRASARAVEGRQIVINAGGRPRVQKVWLDSCT
jgi:type IV fimbrial biogenesis protein FimT